MKLKYLIILVSFLGLVLLASSVFVWQNYRTQEAIQKQDSNKESFEDYYQTAKDLKNADKKTTEISFLAVGDIMLSRNVAGTMAKNDKDAYLPFRGLEDLLHETDFNFGNLESPFSGTDSFNPTGSLVFNAPTWTLPGLVQYNFKVLNLANNHALDQGKEGILYTKKLLTDNGLVPLGVGKDLTEAWQGRVYNAKGIRVGFVGASYSSVNDGGSATNPYVARIEDVAKLKLAIQDLKTKSDFIVVTMHAGTEYVRSPNPSQTAFARAAVDAGADMVIGAHPHWAQTFEKYKDKYIFYSLGNFVFDQMWSQDTKEGLTLKITLSKNGTCTPTAGSGACASDVQGGTTAATLKQIELIPVIIENYSTPRLANETEKQSILKKIGATTDIINP